MLDYISQPEGGLAAGLAAYYSSREAYHQKLADAAHSEWQQYLALTQKYRLLAEEAARAEGLARGKVLPTKAHGRVPHSSPRRTLQSHRGADALTLPLSRHA